MKTTKLSPTMIDCIKFLAGYPYPLRSWTVATERALLSRGLIVGPDLNAPNIRQRYAVTPEACKLAGVPFPEGGVREGSHWYKEETTAQPEPTPAQDQEPPPSTEYRVEVYIGAAWIPWRRALSQCEAVDWKRDCDRREERARIVPESDPEQSPGSDAMLSGCTPARASALFRGWELTGIAPIPGLRYGAGEGIYRDQEMAEQVQAENLGSVLTPVTLDWNNRIVSRGTPCRLVDLEHQSDQGLSEPLSYDLIGIGGVSSPFQRYRIQAMVQYQYTPDHYLPSTEGYHPRHGVALIRGQEGLAPVFNGRLMPCYCQSQECPMCGWNPDKGTAHLSPAQALVLYRVDPRFGLSDLEEVLSRVQVWPRDLAARVRAW